MTKQEQRVGGLNFRARGQASVAAPAPWGSAATRREGAPAAPRRLASRPVPATPARVPSPHCLASRPVLAAPSCSAALDQRRKEDVIDEGEGGCDIFEVLGMRWTRERVIFTSIPGCCLTRYKYHHICNGAYSHPVQMWGWHICTGWRLALV
jgi:hypothetical protein